MNENLKSIFLTKGGTLLAEKFELNFKSFWQNQVENLIFFPLLIRFKEYLEPKNLVCMCIYIQGMYAPFSVLFKEIFNKNNKKNNEKEKKKRQFSVSIAHKMEHFLRRLGLVCRAAFVAVSNTSRTPSLVLAEHSR